ncbi:MAG: dihydroorotate dehydrogenase electron transfer subunit [Oscillospiraceae bacterium]|nr:dihydroorotate dehydrogenase electron transfer subunit [Oscillospiraceae bacterium]
MQILDFTVTENTQLTRDIWRISLAEPMIDHSEAMEPHRRCPQVGQFVNLKIDGLYLRRPISICDWEDGVYTLIYRVVGQGTEKLAQAKPGQIINMLTGLGNGFTIMPTQRPLLIGGGVGVPPLYYLAKELVKAGQRPIALLGFAKQDDVFYTDEFAAVCETKIVVGGYVTDELPADYDAIYACGPEPMLRAIDRTAKALAPGHVQLSFEARMACGFGACMACTCRTQRGYKRICKDGPILTREEIQWPPPASRA